MTQVHLLDALSYLHRLEWIKRRRSLPRLSIAEATGTCTDRSTDHEGGGTCTPAFSLVGAATTVTDGVEPVVLDGVLRVGEGRVVSQAYLEPLGLTYADYLTRLLRDYGFFLHHYVGRSP